MSRDCRPCDSVDELTVTCAQVSAGHVPARPFLLAGQMTTTDPTRSPAGNRGALGVRPRPAAGGRRRPRRSHRRLGRRRRRTVRRPDAGGIERYAPGFGSLVLARRVLSPTELERRDDNLVGGAVNGGTAHLQQSLVFRPVPGLGRAGTPVRGLFLASASGRRPVGRTHPGWSGRMLCG